MERAPPPPRGQLYSPNTDPVATLVQKKKKNKKHPTERKRKKCGLSGDGWGKKTGPSPFPQGRKENTFMEGRQWQNSALILRSEQ